MTSWIGVPPSIEDLENRIDELETLLLEASEIIDVLRVYESTPSLQDRAIRMQERIGLTVVA